MATVYETTEKVFKKLQEDPKGQDLLKRYNHKFQFDVTDEEPFIVDIHDGKVSFKKEDILWPPPLGKDFYNFSLLKGSKQSFVDVFEGRLSPMQGLYTGKFWFSGTVNDKRQPIIVWFFELMLGGKKRPYVFERFKMQTQDAQD